MTTTRFRADRVFTAHQWHSPGEVIVADGRIVSVGPVDPGGSVDPGDPGDPCGSGVLIDLGDCTLAPGLVDVHNHGGGGASFAEDPERAIRVHREAGTTTMVASLVSQSIDALEAQVRRLRPLVESGELAGIHLEGPWLSERYKGAHPADQLRDPLEADVDRLVAAGAGSVRMVTLAVERTGAIETVRRLAAAGVVVALGHSDCTYEQAVAAIDAGVTGATHLFNAMPGLHHRTPGPILALLADARVWSELIVDGVHVRPELVAWVMSVDDRIVLITDAMAAAGCADGHYRLGDLPVEVTDGIARIAGTDTIAGSTLTLAEAVRTAIAAGVPIDTVLRSATVNPARYLGLDGVGELVPGAQADLVAFDADWRVRRVWSEGRLSDTWKIFRDSER